MARLPSAGRLPTAGSVTVNTGGFKFEDTGGATVAKLDSSGNLYVKGIIADNATAGELS